MIFDIKKENDMKHLEELITNQQEYEYFTSQCKKISDKENYALLKKNPIFQSSYLKNVFAICDKRLARQQNIQRKMKFSQKIFQGILLLFIVSAFALIIILGK